MEKKVKAWAVINEKGLLFVAYTQPTKKEMKSMFPEKTHRIIRCEITYITPPTDKP
jgi:hypothetical protein